MSIRDAYDRIQVDDEPLSGGATVSEQTPPAPVFADASREDTRTQAERIAAQDAPAGSTQYNGTSGRIDNTLGDVSGLRQQLQDAARESGVQYSETDLEGILRNTGYSGAGAVSKDTAFYNALNNYAQRATNTPGSGEQGPGTWNPTSGFSTNVQKGITGNGTARSPFSNTSPTFDDPTQRLLEDYALQRFGHLQNPDPNSGTALDQQYLKEFTDKLKGPVYSGTEESQLKAQAYDSIYQDRDTARQQWLQEIGRRGLNPSSGAALEGLRQIDQHYEMLKTQADQQFAKAAITQRRTQDSQVASILGALAGNEEGRLTNAMQYAAIPNELSNQSFQQNLQLAGLGGSPSSLLNSAMQMAQTVANNNQISSQQRAATVAQIMEFIGSLG